jgi:crotonobetainyl-CoA:carnitine CoA-transferase CaiB-like acyl-CoA transferase
MAAFMQGGELLRREGRRPAQHGGRDHAGRGPLDRFYPVRDGWVRVQAGAPDLPALRAAELLPPARDGLAEADAALALALAGLTRAEAVERLRAAAVPAAAARRFEELPDDPEVVAAEVVHAVDRDDGTRYFAPGRYARFSRTERRDVLLPPGLGEHSRAVLAEAGLGPDEIEALIRAGAVVEGPPLVVRLQDYR